MKRNIIAKVEALSEEQLIQVSRYVDSINQLPAKEYDLLPHIETSVRER